MKLKRNAKKHVWNHLVMEIKEQFKLHTKKEAEMWLVEALSYNIATYEIREHIDHLRFLYSKDSNYKFNFIVK